MARRSRYWLLALALALVAALVGSLTLAHHARRERLAARLLQTWPQDVTLHPDLVSFAVSEGRPLFQRHCAVCHGKDMRGNRATGAADLVGGHWLWGKGTVFQIERIILYGIRSGNPKSLDITDMPAFGVSGRLSDGQVRDLVQYILKLNQRPYDVAAANSGQELFHDYRFGCYDCHGANAQGIPDYGAPNLTVNRWNNGGDPQSLYDSIYYGRHRVMPAWQGVLSLEQIRALAVYVHEVSSHASGDAASNVDAYSDAK
jgi:cytochrome c oxidase cbb3-type subunit 3